MVIKLNKAHQVKEIQPNAIIKKSRKYTFYDFYEKTTQIKLTHSICIFMNGNFELEGIEVLNYAYIFK